jgi:uncharacterized membrane protein YgcG
MAKRGALPTILGAVAVFLSVFFVLWLIMALVERFVTGSGQWPGRKARILHHTAVDVTGASTVGSGSISSSGGGGGGSGGGGGQGEESDSDSDVDEEGNAEAKKTK